MPALVAIIMGSQSDWETMRRAAETLKELGVDCDARIVSAHRTPDRLYAFAKGAEAAMRDHIASVIEALRAIDPPELR